MIHERLVTLSRFRVMLFDMVRTWSLNYERNLNSFADKTTIPLKVWTSAYQWAKINKDLYKEEQEECDVYTVAADDNIELTDQIVNALMPMGWNTFNQFKKQLGKFHYRTINQNGKMEHELVPSF